MSFKTRAHNPILDDPQGTLVTSAVTLTVLGCLLLGVL